MIYIAICAIIAILMTKVMKKYKGKTTKDDIQFCCTMGLVIGSFLFLVISAILPLFVETEYVLKEQTPIYAIRDNQRIDAFFFLGAGSIDNEIKYYYITEEDKGKKIQSIDAEDVILYEKEGEVTPRIEVWEKKYKNNFLDKNFLLLSSGEKTKIYIPKGTIKYEYSIDLQ